MTQKQKDKPENIILCGPSPEEEKKDMSITLPRLLIDGEAIMTAKTIEDVIMLINNTHVLGFWLKHPGGVADLFLYMIRIILIHLRAKSDKIFPSIPSTQEGWLGLKDWITDAKKVLRPKCPQNKMALTLIPSVFQVTERTLYRKIKDETLKPYRDKSGKIFLDTVAVAERWKHIKKQIS